MFNQKNIRLTLIVSLSLILGLILGISGTFYFINKARLSSAILANMRATTLYDQGEIDLALGTLYQSIAMNPDDYSPYNLMGKIYLAQGKSSLALKAYEAALKNAKNGNRDSFKSEKAIAYDVKNIQKKVNELKSKTK